MQKDSEEKYYLSKIKKTLKFLVTDKEELLKAGAWYNNNFDACCFSGGAGYSDPVGYYNTYWMGYHLNKKRNKVKIMFFSDFDMTSFNFNKFFSKDNNQYDNEIQQKFLDLLTKLKEKGIIEYEVR